MKAFKQLILMSLITCQMSMANLSGSLDTTFSNDGVTDGWLLRDVNDISHTFRSQDVVVDSLGRILVVGNYSFEAFVGRPTDYETILIRYLKNGQIDTSFGNNGMVKFPLLASIRSEEQLNKLALSPFNGVFVGSSRLRCPTNFDSDCHFDVMVNFVNSTGSVVGYQKIPFDSANTFNDKQDEFKDIIYVATSNPEMGKVAITAEVERTANNYDTDFGIAVIDVDLVTGDLSMDNTFSTDGKELCFFDQTGGTRNQDSPTSIIWNEQGNTYIVGGTVYDGDYPNYYGKNLGFCEFNQAGTLLRKWSTQSNLVFEVETTEYLYDMAMGVDSGGTLSIYVAGVMDNNKDFTLMRYQQTLFGDWFVDTAFGANATGKSTVGFSLPIVGETNDTPTELFIEKNGSILVAGRGQWESSGSRSIIALAKFKQNGILDTSWGIGQTGKAILALATSSAANDIIAGVIEDPKTQEIYVVGHTRDIDNSRYLGFLANIHNDVIFKANFE